MDRPARSPLDLMDEVEKVLGITVVPATWPIGSGDGFRGVWSLADRRVFLFERTAHNATKATVQTAGPGDPKLKEMLGEAAHARLLEDLAMVEHCVEPFAMDRFRAQHQSPMFFCSALTNFGVENILQRFLEIAPAPGPLPTLEGEIPPDAPFFAGFVYKVAANMDRMHRDRVAFLRVCSGHFERGMAATHIRLGREVRLSHPHRFFGQERVSIEEAWPGDVIGLINPGLFRVGDVLSSGPTFAVRNFPRFAPEIFAQVAPKEPSMAKSFGKGLAQLAEEGVVQVFWPRIGAREAILGVVGELQVDVFSWRLENEYDVLLRIDRKPWTRARWLADVSDELLQLLPMVVKDESGRFVALFNSEFEIEYAKSRYKGLALLEHPPSEEERH
jgi:peptide chain release factor 3